MLLDLSALPRRPGGGWGETQKTREPQAGAQETLRFLCLLFVRTWFAHECYICCYFLATTTLIAI